MVNTGAALEMLDAVRGLHDDIGAAVPKMQDSRRADDGIIERVREIGVFDMVLPESLGGPGLTPLDNFRVVEALAVADASLAWSVMIGMDTGFYPGFLSREVFETIYPRRDLITAGKIAPEGRATRSGDGWMVEGRWSFGSCSPHADVFWGGVFLYDDGEMVVDEAGIPRFIAVNLPADSVEVHDNWDTIGLRASGSHDYSLVEPTFVPEECTWAPLEPMRNDWDEPLYRLHWWYIVKLAGVLTGIARHAIDEAISIAEGKLLIPGMKHLIDRPGTAETIARAEGAARSARAYLVEQIEEVWDRCVTGASLEPEDLVGLRLAMVQASDVACSVSRSMFDLVTTSAIQRGSTLSILMADAEVANTHVATSHRTWEPLGRRLSGRDPGPAPFI